MVLNSYVLYFFVKSKNKIKITCFIKKYINACWETCYIISKYFFFKIFIEKTSEKIENHLYKFTFFLKKCKTLLVLSESLKKTHHCKINTFMLH